MYVHTKMDVYTGFIYNGQNLEATDVFFSFEWKRETWSLPTMECYSSLKGSELRCHENTWRNLKFILLSERGQSRKAAHTPYDFKYITVEQPTLWISKNITGFQNLRVGINR